MRALALIVVAGCGFQPVSALGDDDAGSNDAQSGDGSPSVDTDGDGVDDAVDNCPTIPNADQRDFDGDHHGDACDHCPHIPSVDDPDSDGDGVGDACDPRPGMMDHRAYWTGFYDPSEITAWTRTGTWAINGGALVQSDVAAQELSIEIPISVARGYVATAVTPTSVANSGLPAIGIEIKGTHEYGCGVYVSGGSKMPLAETDESIVSLATWSEPFPGTAIDLVIDEVATNGCTIEEGGATITLSSSQYPTPSGTLQLTTGSATATFAYLFVVETSP